MGRGGTGIRATEREEAAGVRDAGQRVRVGVPGGRPAGPVQQRFGGAVGMVLRGEPARQPQGPGPYGGVAPGLPQQPGQVGAPLVPAAAGGPPEPQGHGDVQRGEGVLRVLRGQGQRRVEMVPLGLRQVDGHPAVGALPGDLRLGGERRAGRPEGAQRRGLLARRPEMREAHGAGGGGQAVAGRVRRLERRCGGGGDAGVGGVEAGGGTRARGGVRCLPYPAPYPYQGEYGSAEQAAERRRGLLRRNVTATSHAPCQPPVEVPGEDGQPRPHQPVRG